MSNLTDIISELKTIESDYSAAKAEQRDIRKILLDKLAKNDFPHLTNTAMLYELLDLTNLNQDELIARLTKASRLKIITEALAGVIANDPLEPLTIWGSDTKQEDIPNIPGLKIFDAESDAWVCTGNYHYVVEDDIIPEEPLDDQPYARDWEDIQTYYGPFTNRVLADDEK